MPGELDAIDTDKFRSDYLATDLTLPEIARKHGVSRRRVDELVDLMGIRTRRKPAKLRVDIDVDTLVEGYETGASLKALAGAHGCSRDAVKKRLVRAGVVLRSTEEQMRLVAAARTPKQRSAYAAKANAAARGRKAHPSEKAKRALTVQGLGWDASGVSQNEMDLAALVALRGHEAVPQVACGKYNIDLVFGHVAVEVNGGGWHRVPERAALDGDRIEHLVREGWHVLVIEARYGISGHTADHVVAFLKLASRNPAARRQHRVIRGDGKIIADSEG